MVPCDMLIISFKNILKHGEIYDLKQKSGIELNTSLVEHFYLSEQSKNVLYKYFFNNKEMVLFYAILIYSHCFF